MNRIKIILLICCLSFFPGCQPSEPESPPQQPAKKATADIRESLPEPLSEPPEAPLPEPPPETLPQTNEARPPWEEPVKTRPERHIPLKKMRTKTDPKTGITWYKDKNTPQYNDISSIYLYFGKKENEPPFLRFRIRHCGNEWLEIMSYIIMADHERFLQSLVTFKRLKGTTFFQELYDEPVTPELLVIIKKMIYARKATLRLYGHKGIADVMITNAQRQSMQNVLTAFDKIRASTETLQLPPIPDQK